MRLRIEEDRDFLAFVTGISVTKEEIAAIVSMPDLSVPEVKRYLREGRGRGIVPIIPGHPGNRTCGRAPARIQTKTRIKLVATGISGA